MVCTCYENTKISLTVNIDYMVVRISLTTGLDNYPGLEAGTQAAIAMQSFGLVATLSLAIFAFVFINLAID